MRQAFLLGLALCNLGCGCHTAAPTPEPAPAEPPVASPAPAERESPDPPVTEPTTAGDPTTATEDPPATSIVSLDGPSSLTIGRFGPAQGIAVFEIDRIENSRYVVLGAHYGVTGPSPDGIGIEFEHHFTQRASSEAPPPLTLVGADGACAPTSATRSVIERRFLSPEDAENYGEVSFDVVRVDSACDPSVAIVGDDVEGAAVQAPNEWSGGEGGARDEWTVQIDYPPSRDGICPGFPATVVVRRGSRRVDRFESRLLIERVLLVSTATHTFLLLSDLDKTAVRDLRGHAWVGRPRGRPNGVDYAETCL